MVTDSLGPDDKVLIHDDLLATGGTATASAKLVQQLGGTVSGFPFLIDLEFLGGNKVLRALAPDVHAIIHYR